ncbi:MAG: ABC transporter permease subunit [Armatimonadetes bacterium]|nr:ABC transporter permease subunit [Armatimonadota bacterium]
MNKFKIIWVIARGVIVESLRRKDLWVVAILGFLIVLSAGALGFFGMQGLESFAKDLGTTVLGGLSTILAITSTARLMPDEIKNRTLYPLLARPISRFDLLAGKLLGAVAISWISFAILAALTGVALAIFGVQFEPVMAQYVLCKMMGLVIICSVTLALSLLITANAAVTMSFILLFGAGMITQALSMAYESGQTGMAPVFRFVNAILPQTNLFDLGSRAANSNWGTVPAWVVGSLAVYMALYSAAMLGLGWSKFKNQAV